MGKSIVSNPRKVGWPRKTVKKPTAVELIEAARVAVQAAGDEASEELRVRGMSKRDLLMWQLRKAQAELWGAVDEFSITHHDLTIENAKDPASLKVRARSATAVLIVYDDGATYFADRRLGGLSYRPYLLEFNHSDPARPGTVEEAIKFRTRGDSDVKSS